MVEILIWITALFAAGSVLILERRCLGQRALVQPLALCLLAGWYVDNTETGLWLGLSLQLLSLAPSRVVDWALVSVIAASGLLATAHFDIPVHVGQAGASTLLFISVLAGMASRYIERNFAKRDREKVEVRPPWRDMDPARAVESSVYHAIYRWFFIGGLEVLSGLGLAIVFVKGAVYLGDTPAFLTQTVAIGIPTLGAAVLLSSLTGVRFIVWAGVSSGLSLILLQVVTS